MIKYTTSLEKINPEQLNGFFVGWPNPPKSETHLQILQNSYKVILAVDDEKDQVVGFINAVSDGILAAYIPLLEVLPEYQKQGIGKELVNRLLRELDNLYMIDLVCDHDLKEYYEGLGMFPAVGMVVRNYSRQSGE